MANKKIFNTITKSNWLINLVEQQYMTEIPTIKIGDSIQVNYLVPEGNKERTQKIEGIVIAKKNKGLNKTITIRRFIGKFGLEQIIFLHSPKIQKIKIVQHAKIRQAKLYYIRSASGKNARLKRKFS